MRTLNIQEIEEVTGGNIILVGIGMAGAVFAWGFSVGQGLRERDDAASCP